MSDAVKRHYDANPQGEWDRLTKDPYHSLEYIVTMHFLEKYLPERGLILDVGGGPGRYTIELAKRGYDVVLFDFSSECLRFASEKISEAGVGERVKELVEGSAVDLSAFPDGRFDAVLFFGPLYHLIEKADREKAVLELARVAKKGATIFASAINFYAPIREILRRPDLNDELIFSSHDELYEKGVHRSLWHEGVDVFPDAYFMRPEELRRLLEGANIETVTMAACEGLSAHLRRETNALSEKPEHWDAWLKLLLKTCQEPSALGLGEHLLYVGKAV